jgi:hypothetical protein
VSTNFACTQQCIAVAGQARQGQGQQCKLQCTERFIESDTGVVLYEKPVPSADEEQASKFGNDWARGVNLPRDVVTVLARFRRKDGGRGGSGGAGGAGTGGAGGAGFIAMAPVTIGTLTTTGGAGGTGVGGAGR